MSSSSPSAGSPGAGDADELVAVAFPISRGEAQMIQALLESGGIPSLLHQAGVDGPTLGFGLLNPDGGAHRVMVHAGRSAEARALLAEARGDGEAWPESANARHLADGMGRKPRSYGVIGAYVRAWAWSLGALAFAFAIFMLLRAV